MHGFLDAMVTSLFVVVVVGDFRHQERSITGILVDRRCGRSGC
jgi:hypothetical protein